MCSCVCFVQSLQLNISTVIRFLSLTHFLFPALKLIHYLVFVAVWRRIHAVSRQKVEISSGSGPEYFLQSCVQCVWRREHDTMAHSGICDIMVTSCRLLYVTCIFIHRMSCSSKETWICCGPERKSRFSSLVSGKGQKSQIKIETESDWKWVGMPHFSPSVIMKHDFPQKVSSLLEWWC